MTTLNAVPFRSTIFYTAAGVPAATGSALTIGNNGIPEFTRNLGSTMVAIGASTNQTYNRFTNGLYTNTLWGSTLTGLTAVNKVAMSYSGQYQLAIQNGSSTINTSANSGLTWGTLTGSSGLPAGALAYPQATAPGVPAYTCIAASATGQYQLASVNGGLLYMCVNGTSSVPTFTALGMGAPTYYLPFENNVTEVITGTNMTTPGSGGAPTYRTGVVGSYAANLNNTAAGGTPAYYLRLPMSGFSNAITISGWFNLQSYSSSPQVICSTGGTYIVVYINQTSNTIGFNINGGPGVTTSFAVSLGIWYSFTAIAQGNGTCYLYINNALIGTYTMATALASMTTFSIGSYDNSALYAFNGFIDDFRIYNSAVAFSPIIPMNWAQTAVSGTGQYMLAAAARGGLFMSSNFGASWSQLTTIPTVSALYGLTISASGQYMATNGIISPSVYYPFENNVTDIAGGVTSQFVVASGYYSNMANPGSYPGTVTYVAGKVGSNAANVTAGAIVANYSFPMTAFSVSFWLYPISGFYQDTLILSNTLLTVSGGSPVYFGMNPSNQLQMFGAVTLTTSSFTGTLNAWNHLAFTYTPGTITAYMNGVFGFTISATFTQFLSFNIGLTLSGYVANCYVDDFRIYPSVLTASNIATLNANVAATLPLVGSTTYYSTNYGSAFTNAAFVGTLLGTSDNGKYTISSDGANYYVVSNYLAGYSSAPSITGTTANTVTSAALSATGQYMVMTTSGTTSNVYYSINYGSTFTALTIGSAAMTSCAISADGSYLTVSNATTVYTLNLNTQGYAVSIGNQTGLVNQGLNTIAIGNQAGVTNQSANSIILNGSGSALNAYDSGFFVSPISAYDESYASSFNLLGYGSDSQIVQTGMSVLANGNVGVGMTNPSSNFQVATGFTTDLGSLKTKYTTMPLSVTSTFTLGYNSTSVVLSGGVVTYTVGGTDTNGRLSSSVNIIPGATYLFSWTVKASVASAIVYFYGNSASSPLSFTITNTYATYTLQFVAGSDPSFMFGPYVGANQSISFNAISITRLDAVATSQLGIGTTTPVAILDVYGSFRILNKPYVALTGGSGIEMVYDSGGSLTCGTRSSTGTLTTAAMGYSGLSHTFYTGATAATTAVTITNTGTLVCAGNIMSNGTVLPVSSGSVWATNGTAILYTAGNVSLARNRLVFSSASVPNDFNHSIFNNANNLDAEGAFDGFKYNGYDGHWFRVANASGAVPTTAMFINVSGQIGIGTTTTFSNQLLIHGGNAISGISLGNFNTTGAGVKYIGITASTNGTLISANSGFSGITFGGPNDGGGTSGYLAFHTHSFGVASNERMRIDKNGNVGIGIATPSSTLQVNGSLAKSSGTFDIAHPLYPDTDQRLVHSFIEGPRCDLIYRGKTSLVNGMAIVDINKECTHNPECAMDNGTFEALCGDAECFLQNKSGFGRVIGSISGATLTITAEHADCNDTIVWMVIAERADPFIKQWDRTNLDGHLITQYTVNHSPAI